jgi:hypothetical protein
MREPQQRWMREHQRRLSNEVQTVKRTSSIDAQIASAHRPSGGGQRQGRTQDRASGQGPPELVCEPCEELMSSFSASSPLHSADVGPISGPPKCTSPQVYGSNNAQIRQNNTRGPAYRLPGCWVTDRPTLRTSANKLRNTSKGHGRLHIVL